MTEDNQCFHTWLCRLTSKLLFFLISLTSLNTLLTISFQCVNCLFSVFPSYKPRLLVSIKDLSFTGHSDFNTQHNAWHLMVLKSKQNKQQTLTLYKWNRTSVYWFCFFLFLWLLSCFADWKDDISLHCFRWSSPLFQY
jgi:hypothetical protein